MSEEYPRLNAFCRWEDEPQPTHVNGQVTGPPAPYYVPCCGCLQFDQTCNSQYLGVA